MEVACLISQGALPRLRLDGCTTAESDEYRSRLGFRGRRQTQKYDGYPIDSHRHVRDGARSDTKQCTPFFEGTKTLLSSSLVARCAGRLGLG